MNRRQMLKWLAGGAALAGAGIVVAPARTIFLPPRGGWIVMDRPFDEVIMGIDSAVGDDYGAITWLRKELDRMMLIDYRVLRPGESPLINVASGSPARIQIEYGA